MGLYISISALILVIYLIGCNHFSNDDYGVKGNSKRSRCVVCFVLLILWVLTAFRSINIGNDTWTYVGVYNSTVKSGYSSSFYMEFGYKYFMLICDRILHLDAHAFLILCATICYVVLLWYVIANSENYYLSLCFVYCLIFSSYTNLLRQGIAMSLGAVAYVLMLKKKKIVPILLILLATTFHTSAIILLALFIKWVPKRFSHIFFVAIVLLLISASGVGNELLARAIPRYAGYFESARVGSGYLALLIDFIRSMIFCYIGYRAFSSDPDNIHRLNLFVLYPLVIALAFNMNLISRAGNYYTLLLIVELSNALKNSKSNYRQPIAICVGIILLLVFNVTMILRPDWNHLYPYEFWK